MPNRPISATVICSLVAEYLGKLFTYVWTWRDFKVAERDFGHKVDLPDPIWTLDGVDRPWPVKRWAMDRLGRSKEVFQSAEANLWNCSEALEVEAKRCGLNTDTSPIAELRRALPKVSEKQIADARAAADNLRIECEAVLPTATELWNSDPSETFEALRDSVCDALHQAAEIHRQAILKFDAIDEAIAAEYPVDRSEILEKERSTRWKQLHDELKLWSICPDRHMRLLSAVREAQAIWFDTPISRYLDRPDGPVFLHGREVKSPTTSGSCYHDLCLAVAVGCWKFIEEGCSADSFVATMRYHSAAGDMVTQHLVSLASNVRSECVAGIAKWKAEAAPQLPLGSGAGADRADEADGGRTTRPGAKVRYDKAEDSTIADRFRLSGFKRINEFAPTIGKTEGEVRAAIDRDRHRKKPRKQKRK